MKYLEILIRDPAAEAREANREARRKDRERAAWIQRGFLAALLVALVACVVTLNSCAGEPRPVLAAAPAPGQTVSTPAVSASTYSAGQVNAEPDTTETGPLLETAPVIWSDSAEPLEHGEIVEALLGQGYLSDAVPLSYEQQDYMRTYCAAYGCPYPLALAVAEVESNFSMDTTGAEGEVGIMQLNPGPGGSYHGELEAATGLDPATPEGNIAGGCYLLGKYLDTYGDPAKAVMAYRMGEAGADRAIAAGVDPEEYASEDMEAMERWECMVNAWRGE